METSQQPQFSDKIIKQLNSSFDVKRLLGAILSNWYWFLLAISVTITAGFLYLRYTTPVYSMDSALLIDEGPSNGAQNVLSKIDQSSSAGADQSVNLYNQMFILRSQDLIEKVIDSLNLNIRYWAVGRVRKTEIYQECPVKIVFDSTGNTAGNAEFTIKQIVDGQFEIRQNKITERVLYDTWVKRPFGRFKIVYVEGPQVNKGYLKSTEILVRTENHTFTNQRILTDLKVNSGDGRTSLIDIAYTDNIPQRGVDLLNILIYFYQKKELENITQSAEKTREFINARKSSMIEDIRGMDTLAENIKVKNDLVNPTAQTDEFITGKTTSEQEINDLMVQRQAVTTLKRQVLNNNNQIITALGVQDPTLTTLITQYNALIQQHEVYEANYGALSPYLTKTESDIASARRRIAEAADRIISGLNINIQNSANNAAEYNSRIRAVPTVDRSIKDATRGYDVLQSLYLLLYQKGIENEISLYAATNKSKIVVAPFSSDKPIRPVKNKVYGIVLLIGILIPTAFFVTREMLNNTVINENDIESLTAIPVIGTISRVETGETIVVGPRIRTGVAEQFRLIRANLEFMSSGDDKKVYLLTSSNSGEGKSFISINLGLTMTLAKKRVIIMEFDLRKPQITNYLGLSNEGGISSYLAGFTDLDSVIKASGVHENLFVANCGPIPPNPGELLVQPTTTELIGRLMDMFDVVIIDTAPIGLVSDALILSQYANINLFVVRQSLTVKHQIRMFDALHRDGKILHTAILFNGVAFLKKYGYGYGGAKYGYGYAYGGYGDSNGYYENSEEQPQKKKQSSFARFFMK